MEKLKNLIRFSNISIDHYCNASKLVFQRDNKTIKRTCKEIPREARVVRNMSYSTVTLLSWKMSIVIQ